MSMKEEVNKKLNIYEKLQKCRMELNKKKLTKSGENKYSNYKYFELSDFLPTINELFYINKLSSEFNLYQDKAVLKVIDVEEQTSEIVFEVPTAEAKISGCSPIQALGGQITYLRRYLYINALEIAETDLIDKTKKEENIKTDTTAEDELSFIYISKMEQLEIETETDHEELLNYFKVKSNTEMTLKQLKEAVNILEKKKNKKKEEVF